MGGPYLPLLPSMSSTSVDATYDFRVNVTSNDPVMDKSQARKLLDAALRPNPKVSDEKIKFSVSQASIPPSDAPCGVKMVDTKKVLAALRHAKLMRDAREQKTEDRILQEKRDIHTANAMKREKAKNEPRYWEERAAKYAKEEAEQEQLLLDMMSRCGETQERKNRPES